MALKISKENDKDTGATGVDANTNNSGNTPRTGANQSGKPSGNGKKKIMGLDPFVFWVAVAGGVLLLLIIITAVIALAVKKPAPKPDEAQPPQTEQVTQDPNNPDNAQKPNEGDTYQINPALLAHYEAKNKESGQYWAIVRDVVNENTGAIEKSKPFRVAVNQAVDKVIMQSPYYSVLDGGGITTVDGKGMVRFSDPLFKQFYMQAVDSVLSDVSGRYDVRHERVVFNDGTNIADVAIVVIKDANGNVDVDSPELLMQFENDVLSSANLVVPAMITQIQQQYQAQNPSGKTEQGGANNAVDKAEQERQAEQARIEKAKLEAEVQKSQQVISQLKTNLQETRQALLQSEDSHNQTRQAMYEQDKRMGQFIQHLENQPSVNKKLNLVTIDEQKHGLKVMAVVGDRVFLQDKKGEQYTASVGDVIVLQDGRKLTLIDAENKKVMVN